MKTSHKLPIILFFLAFSGTAQGSIQGSEVSFASSMKNTLQNSMITSRPSILSKPLESNKKSQKKTKFSTKEERYNWVLFQWLNEQHISFEWAYGFLTENKSLLPKLLQENINDSFKNDVIFYANFHQDIFQFPYWIKWGLRASAGITRNGDLESLYFYPMSLSTIFSLQVLKHQFVIPFFEAGYSIWNVNFEDFSEPSFFWTLGTHISLSLFKPSFKNILINDYGIIDTGFIVELKHLLSPLDHKEEDGTFFQTLHIGLFFHF